MEMKSLFERNYIFSWTGKATKGSSFLFLEKNSYDKKLVMHSWIRPDKFRKFYWH
jgi:hypothetical protein